LTEARVFGVARRGAAVPYDIVVGSVVGVGVRSLARIVIDVQ